MTSDPAGATAFIQADLSEPGKILADPAVRKTLDLGEPVALMLIAILMLFRDDENPRRIVSELIDALPPGSYLAVTHATADFNPQEMAEAVAVTAFFAGLELVEPGVVPVLAWRPDKAALADPGGAYYYGAIGRKP